MKTTWQLHLGLPGPALRGRRKRTTSRLVLGNLATSNHQQEMIETIRTAIPKGRLSKIDDIVPAYVFLASDEARYFVGQCLSPTVVT